MEKLTKIGCLKIGDDVEFHKGGYGKVISLKSPKEPIGTERPTSCCVQWDDNFMRGNPGNSLVGRNISISLDSAIYKELGGNYTLRKVEVWKFKKQKFKYSE